MSADKTVFVAVKDTRRETARALLDAADKAGVDQTLVRSVHRGYEVPEAVATEYEKAQAADEKKPASKTTARKATTEKE